MKVKVMLVDDEHLERTLIRYGTDWEGNGFEIIGEAESGKEALEMLETVEPDIILTDINMPQMDGLVFSEKVRERYPEIRIVIITGYREFEYAQKAVKLGVTEFLLKPIDHEEILKISLKLKQQLAERRQFYGELHTMKQQLNASLSLMMERFLADLIQSKITEAEAMLKLTDYGLSFLNGQVVCALIKFGWDIEEMQLGGSTERHSAQCSVEKPLSLLGDYVCFYLNENELVSIIGCGEEPAMTARRYEEMLCELAVSLPYSVTIGIGSQAAGIHGVVISFKQAKEAVKAKVICGCNNVIRFSDLSGLKSQRSTLPEMDWNAFSLYVKGGIREKAMAFIAMYADRIIQAGPLEIEIIRMQCINILSTATAVLYEVDRDAHTAFSAQYNIYYEISKIEAVKDVEKVLRHLVEEVLRYMEKSGVKRTHQLAEEAKSYIQAHLTEPELSLKGIAKNLFANDSYLSRIFKKETGENITDYIMKQRINKGIEYLKGTNLKAYEIAQKIGINDPHYFSICFKKYTGKSINEFRKR